MKKSGVISLETIEQFLLSEYQKRNNLDFYAHSRRLAKVLNTSTKQMGKKLTILATRGILVKHTEGIWRTNFSHKEDVVPVPVKKHHWWPFKKKFESNISFSLIFHKYHRLLMPFIVI